MKFIDSFLNLIKYKEKEEYNFILPDADASQDSQTSNNSQELEPLEKVNETVYPSIDVNLEYIKVKYNVLINSDIKIREFFINAKNRQYRAFLLYIDGMIDTESINKFVIEPLMLKNISNTNSSDENIVSTAVTNNAVVRRIKKFNLVDYISELYENDIQDNLKIYLENNSIEMYTKLEEDYAVLELNKKVDVITPGLNLILGDEIVLKTSKVIYEG